MLKDCGSVIPLKSPRRGWYCNVGIRANKGGLARKILRENLPRAEGFQCKADKIGAAKPFLTQFLGHSEPSFGTDREQGLDLVMSVSSLPLPPSQLGDVFFSGGRGSPSLKGGQSPGWPRCLLPALSAKGGH